MSLKNSQYDAILRTYQQDQFENKHRQDQCIQKAYEALPQLAEIDCEISSLCVSRAKKLLFGEETALNDLLLFLPNAVTFLSIMVSLLITWNFIINVLTVRIPVSSGMKNVIVLNRRKLICSICSLMCVRFWKKKIFPGFLSNIIQEISSILPQSCPLWTLPKKWWPTAENF